MKASGVSLLGSCFHPLPQPQNRPKPFSAATSLTPEYLLRCHPYWRLVVGPLLVILATLSLHPILLEAATITWDGGGDGTNWTQAVNWVGDVLPGTADDVVIDKPNQEILVVLAGGSVTVRSLQSRESLTLSSGSLTVTTGASQIDGAFTLTPNTTLNVRGTNTTFSATGATTLNGANLAVAEGGSLLLPGVTRFSDTGGCCGTLWDAQGRGSVLRLSNLTNVVGNPVGSWDSTFRARSGATLDLPALVEITSGSLSFMADGSNSVLNLPALTRATNAIKVILEARASGSLSAPLLVDGSRVGVIRRSGGKLPTTQFTRVQTAIADGVSIDLSHAHSLTSQGTIQLLNGGTIDLSAVTNADGINLQVQGGSTLTLPALTRYNDTAGCCGTLLEASGVGSVIRLPALTELNGNPIGSWQTTVRALNGARFELPQWSSQKSGAVILLADGTNSVVDASSLAVVSQGSLGIEAKRAGRVLAPQLQNGGLVSLTLRSGGEISNTQFNELQGMTLDGVSLSLPNLIRFSSRGTVSLLNGASLSLGAVTNIDGLSLSVSSGTTLSLPAVTRYVDTSGCCGATWEVNGSGALLSFPSLNTLLGNPTWTMELRALGGGRLSLGELMELPDGNLSILADGSNSVVDLPKLEHAISTGNTLTLTAQNRGTLAISNLTLFNGATLRKFTGGLIPVAQFTNVDGSSFRVGTGEQIILPNITSYFDSGGCCGALFEASGAGALLQFPSLTQLTGNPTDAWPLGASALAGGRVDLGQVRELNDGSLSLLADGTNSVVDLHRITEFEPVKGAFWAEARVGGRVLIDSLKQLSRATLTLRNSGFFPTAQLERLLNSNVTIDERNALFTGLVDNRGTTFNYLKGGTATFPPEADIAPIDIDAPPLGTSGQPLQLVWALTNRSNLLIAGPREDTLYLSTDASLGNELKLGSFTVLGDLPPGGVQRVTNTVILPGGLSGNRWFVVEVDSAHQIYEGAGEANNQLIDNQPVSVSVADLVVDQVTTSSTAVFGSSLNVTWRVRNAGSTAAPSPWFDTLYLSTNTTISPGAYKLASFPAITVPLNSTASYTQTKTIPLPLSGTLSPGTWFVVMKTDANNAQAEADENNNLRATTGIAVSRPPLPDLVAVRVIAPTSTTPGASFPIIWTITNVGPAIAQGPWEEALLLSTDALAGGDQVLNYINVTNTLPPGGSITRTQLVTLPVDGSSGSLRFGIQVDTRSQVVESDESNNISLAANATLVPSSLTLTTSASEVAEATANPAAKLRVSRNGNLQSTLLVSLNSSAPSRLSVPTSMTFPTNVATLELDLTVAKDGISDGNHSVSLVAAASGYIGATNVITVVDSDVPHLGLSLTSPLMIEGQTTTATLTRQGLLSQALNVTLGNSSPGQISTPPTITIPANQASVTFPVLAVDDTYVESQRTYSLEASAVGYQGASTFFSVVDNDLPQLTLAFTAPRLNEGAGPGVGTLLVTRSQDGVAPLQVQLTRSRPDQIIAPELITFAPGELTQSVPLSPVDDNVIEPELTVTFVAQALDTLSLSPIPPGTSTNLVLIDNDGPSLRIELPRTWVCTTASGGSELSKLALQLKRTGSLSAAATATLTTDVANLISLPSTVSFAANQEVATVTVQAIGTPTEAHQALTLRATAPGYSEAGAALTLTANCEPDLVISNVVVAAKGVTDAYFVVNYREQNIGSPFAVVSKPPGITNLSQNVFLSNDRYPGNDTLLGTVIFDGEVNPYTFLERSATFRLPSIPGDYWIVVQADGGSVVEEVSEANNFTVSPTAIHVDPAYTASVSASPHSALAGTPIALSGSARKFGTTQAAPFELVSLHIGLRETERVIAALTDASGNYSAVFTPLPGEAGTYTVGASHPGVSNAPSQDTFTLLGMKASPASLSVTVPALTTLTQQVVLQNLGDIPLSALTTSVVGAPDGFQVSVTTPTSLAPFAQGLLEMQLSSNLDANFNRLFTVRVTSAEGAVADIIVDLTSQSLRPRLVVNPPSLTGGAVRGGQRFVEFSVANVGGAASGPLQLVLPALPFVHITTPMPMPSLAAGASNTVTLQIAPELDTNLGEFAGNLLVSAPSTSVSLPFDFRVLSTNQGTLRIEVTDQFTYYAEGAPRVTNAVVELRDPFSHATLYRQTNDVAGIALFANLPESYYELQVTAPDHEPYRRVLLLPAGVETREEALLTRETIQFIWNVVPTEIGDRTHITIESVFETVVPLPVVTVEPSVIDLANFPNGGTMNLTVTNHGLLAAQQTRISFSQFDCWQITPLISDIGTLAARSSIVVPVKICRDVTCSGDFAGCSQSGFAPSSFNLNRAHDQAAVDHVTSRIRPAASGGGGGGCGGGAVVFSIPCGAGSVGGGAPIGVSNAGGGGCGASPTGGGSGSGSISLGGGAASGGKLCDPCGLEVAGALAKCAFNFLLPLALEPIENCILDSAKCGADIASQGATVSTGLDCLSAIVSCLEAAGKDIPGLGQALTALGCLDDLLSACGGGGLAGAAGFGGGSSPPPPPLLSAAPPHYGYPGLAEVDRAGTHLVAMLGSYSTYFGNGRWIGAMTEPSFLPWLSLFRNSINAASESGETLSVAEMTALLNHELAKHLAPADISTFLARWNRTVDYYRAGVFDSAHVPASQSNDFIAIDTLAISFGSASNAITSAHALGYPTVIEEVRGSIEQLRRILAQPQDGVCAHVRLKIDQEAVIARDAFRATLEILNNSGSPMTNVAVELTVYRPDGSTATSLFGIPAPSLGGISSVEGTGRVEAGSSATAAWNILPTVDAAIDGPQIYQVGGRIRYTQDGVPVTVPLALVSITVHPLAQLALTYFHQRDVLGDDPFTDAIEPSVPYSLAVMVQNTGQGTARNLRITSAQPKIIENEKGLFIDFQIIATQVAGKNLVPSLTADFGDVAPKSVTIGQWLLKSTLQGLFTDYSASFEHLDGLGDKRLSLIQSVEIRELIRMVRAPGAMDDGLPDMLVNDFPDFEDLPDTLYLSDGSVQPVTIVQSGSIGGALSAGNLQVTLQSSLPAGWTYLRIPDPGNGRFRLSRVLRSDGTPLSTGTNVWTTDRTFVGGGHRPVLEHKLHLLDYNSTGSYTLVYESLAAPDVTAPTSQLGGLPVVSDERIPLTWSGEDDPSGTGVRFYDVFVSVNNGVFLPWLERTPDTGAIYEGHQGNTYAFYTLATDLSGNRESAPFVADAITSVNLTNSPPALLSTSLTLNEGETLRYTNVVVDPDVPPQSLSFSLLGAVPSGATLSPQTGVLTWPTTEATGPATEQFFIRVTDNGFPSYSSTGVVTVVVREVNRAPTLGTLSNYTLREGQLLTFTNGVSDPDLPANPLTFSLETGAPPGASVHPTTGVFSWRPTESQGGVTYTLGIVVTDHGEPSLSATQRFNVLVRDTLGDFELSLGSTNLFLGERQSVPLSLKSGLELSRIDFVLSVPQTTLSQLALEGTSAEISSVSLIPLGQDRTKFSLTFDPNQSLSGLRTFSQLGFTASASGDSAIVPLRVQELTGVRSDGQPIATTTARNGRVFVIGRRPLLDVSRLTNGPIGLWLYARPETNYTIEYTTDLQGAPWNTSFLWRQTNAVHLFNTGIATNGMLFWRALGP